MNRGEGAKFAAKAKSGQIGIFLFKDTKTNKNKKFGYKKRAQTFPIRKVTTTQDSEAENRPAPQKKPVSEKSLSQKGNPTNPREAGSKSVRETTTSSDRDSKQGRKDFVKRNVQKVSGKTKEASKEANTIALTQDQLNAILKSIGQVAGSESVASIEIENGDLKVKSPDKEPAEDKLADSNKDSKQDGKDGDDHTKKADGDSASPVSGAENILALLAKTRERTPSPVPSTKPPTPSKTPASVTNTVSSQSPKKPSRHKKTEPGKDENVGEAKTGDANQPGSKEKVDAGQVEFAYLSLAERKRRKWKQELDEQVALKQQQSAQDRHVREVVVSRMGMTHHETRTQEQQERKTVPTRNAPQAKDVRTSGDNFSPDSSPPGVAPSSLGVIETQRVVPAAMRSSFLIGGQGSAGSRLNDHNAQVKRRQQQEWLRELEQQRIEAQERKEQDKKRQRAFESDLTQQWAEPVDPPKTRQPTRGRPQVQDDTAVPRQTADREGDRHREVEQPRSAPPQETDVGANIGSEMHTSEGRSHIRPHNLLLDPAEIERREAQRLKHMEHMLAVKAQVEEKQRLKREAEERRRQEEMEEERRLAQQRTNLQHQFDSEKDKQRKREEDEAARHRALVESMQAAYQEAQQEKHQKRLDKLAKMGHDTSNLRRSWENQQEVSPRYQPNSQAAFKASPRPEQPTMPQPVQHSPGAPLPHHVMDHVTSQVTEGPVMVDAFTSPVYDQAVQTEYHFSPNEDISFQGGQLEREPSAHIEYKPDRRLAGREPARKEQKPERTKANKPQGRRMKPVQEELQEGSTRGAHQRRRTSRASSPGSEQDYTRKKSVGKTQKPVWGVSTKTKKLQQNSDKDLTVSKRKREERRRQRAAELLAEQERNAPARLTKAKKPGAAVSGTQPDEVQTKPTRSRAGSYLDRNPNYDKTQRGRTDSMQDRAESQTWTDVNSNLPDTPPLKNGDFVPFLRSDEPLMSEDSVPVTPESRQMQRHRKTVKTIIADDSERQRKEDRIRLPVQTEKDPLLNPDRLKDTEQRQERILQQLSHLRQGLMMKQREMELGLNSPVMM